ncbi:methyltransferase domain-containing protein [Mesorhizobium sp. M7D.F.Ca.US.005.01.1.1]|uniref:class I SAM-dependent methyltransferase n=1 Tax=Mesorhizobium sp. M7D.F.Ca.US.005.01.1.1 TaxID=2493678 RepID=UPI000F75ABD7|nr:class I SAM-dependent methyltransferase [Mesorhizobium sp. M7D.F.Ca.US.005.01.1.1]AZO42342.1 methyltransferase domain-containing protein [Mesorhizobium sp. M7D.F.Ca.US.005.01.1.1]
MSLTYTGERYHPELLDEIRQEHMHRYVWTLGMTDGLDVVDLACGEGFGSRILAERARSVIGVDVSDAAVQHAASRYTAANLSFICADATELPLEDHCADVVVSFETIEHLADQAGMLSEISRILKPTGFLVMSSPNTEVYSVKQDHKNEFHTRELTRGEFVGLLEGRFPALRLFGQRLSVASSILSCDGDAGGTASVFRDEGNIEQSAREIPETMYYLALAASREDCLPPMAASFLVSASYDVYWRMRGVYQQMEDRANRLVAEYGQVMAEKDRLAAENGQVMAEKNRLVAEYGQVMAEKDRLAAENGQVMAEKNRLVAEYGQVMAEKDRLAAENGQVMAEKNRLVAEYGQVMAEKDRLAAENGQVMAEKNRLVAECGQVMAEKDRLEAKTEQLMTEKDQLSDENQSLGGFLNLAGSYMKRRLWTKPERSPCFDPDYYLRSNPDVATSKLDPFVHYVRYGRSEGRLPKAPMNGEEKRAHAPQVRENSSR